jgi:hypothetical protein
MTIGFTERIRAKDSFRIDSGWDLRLPVGILGLFTPLPFMVFEARSSGLGRIAVRGSLSAYYHTPMREFLVVDFVAVALLLIVEGRRTRKTLESWPNLAGGLSLLGVVFFPTWRDVEKPPCSLSHAFPPTSCAWIEEAWGEALVAHVHQACAIVFTVSLLSLTFLFAQASGMQGCRKRRQWVLGSAAMALLSSSSALLSARLGLGLGLWLGEVLTVWLFAGSCLAMAAPQLMALSAGNRKGLRESSIRVPASTLVMRGRRQSP